MYSLPPVHEIKSGASSPTMVRSLTRKSGGVAPLRSMVPDIVFVGRECRRLGEGAAQHNSGAATGDFVSARRY